MKSVYAILLMCLLVSPTLADFGMMGYGSSSMIGVFGMGLVGLVYFVIGALIFSIVFWLTYTGLIKK